jgi:menaquinone-dependent protoporphyrinogen oxidase
MLQKRMLVAYATRVGTTIEVANTVAQVLQDWGATVDVRSTHERIEVEQYDAVILGSAIRQGKWLPEAIDFLKANRKLLAQLPVALYVVCMTMCEDTPRNRETVLSYLDPALGQVPEIHPISIGLFAGAVDPKRFSLAMRWVIRQQHLPTGDHRNWDAIRNWTCSVAPALLGEPELLYP